MASTMSFSVQVHRWPRRRRRPGAVPCREFRVVPGVDPLRCDRRGPARRPAPRRPRQPLEVQLQGDPQEGRCPAPLSRCVVKGRAAAPPAMACSVGPSTSTKPCPASVLRIDCTIFVCCTGSIPLWLRYGSGQYRIPLPQFGVGQALCFSGVRFRSPPVGRWTSVASGQLAHLGAGSTRRRCRSGRPVELLGQLQFFSPTCFMPISTWIAPLSRADREDQLSADARAIPSRRRTFVVYVGGLSARRPFPRRSHSRADRPIAVWLSKRCPGSLAHLLLRATCATCRFQGCGAVLRFGRFCIAHGN